MLQGWSGCAVTGVIRKILGLSEMSIRGVLIALRMDSSGFIRLGLVGWGRLFLVRHPMSITAQRISRTLERKGYRDVSTEKKAGTWQASAFDPLKETCLIFENLGSSGEAARQSITKIPAVPNHYVCGHSYECGKCKSYDQPLAYTSPVNGDFMHRCRTCRNEWVASTAKEQEEDARIRMLEAQEILNPELRRFLRRDV